MASQVVILLVCVAVLGAMVIVGLRFARRQATLRLVDTGDAFAAMGGERLDPYEFIRQAYVSDRKGFRHSLTRASEVDMRRNTRLVEVSFDEAVVDDLGTAMRTVLDYRGRLREGRRGPSGVIGQIRQYYHPGGAIVVGSLCFTDTDTCEARQNPTDIADGAVLEHLDGEGLDGLLPEIGTCQPGVAPASLGAAPLMNCRLHGEVTMTFMRLDIADTRAAMRQITADPKFKKLMKELVQDGAR